MDFIVGEAAVIDRRINHRIERGIHVTRHNPRISATLAADVDSEAIKQGLGIHAHARAHRAVKRLQGRGHPARTLRPVVR